MDSDVAETLNYLRPPVRRIHKYPNSNKHCERISNPKTNSVYLKDYRTLNTVKTDYVSSSLVLRKTGDKEHYEKSSVLSYTNLRHIHNSVKDDERPIIQVTVIPNNTSHGKRRNRRHVIKKLQNTLSNQESSIKAKNVYLVVSGKKREKVYEIKTAGSAEFSNTSKNETFVSQIGEFQQFIDSLNMDRKKNKNKKKDVPDPPKKDLVKDVFEGGGVHFPNDRMHSDGKDLKINKSRVRISGRLGLTEDDKYVLRCQATVDDKPVPIDYEEMPLDGPATNQKDSKKDKNSKCSKFQANFKFGSTSGADKNPKQFSIGFENKESQATQTNLNAMCFSNIETLRIFSNNEHSICTCTKAGTTSGFDTDCDASRNCTNPLVIISVYPKQEPEENTKSITKVPIVEASKPESKKSKFQWNKKSNYITVPVAKSSKTNEKPEINNKYDARGKNEPKAEKSRSPSPSPSRGISNKYKADNSPPGSRTPTNESRSRPVVTSPRNRSPSPSPTRGVISKPKPECVPSKRSSTKFVKDSPLPNVSKPPTSQFNRDKKLSIQKANQAPTTQKNKLQRGNGSKLKEQGINTDHRLTKKALVDNYTKQLQRKNNKYSPKNDVSNVTVNIDTDNEYYDLLFRQGDLTTDFRVRKTMKSETANYDPDSPSLENFLLTSINDDDARKKSFSQTYLVDPTDCSAPMSCRSGLLMPTDSIEICHRREEKANSSGKISVYESKSDNHDMNDENGKDFYAPVKHYRGDSCSILDPVERDREIRELLGVPRTSMSKHSTSYSCASNVCAKFHQDQVHQFSRDKDSFNAGEDLIPMPYVYQFENHQKMTGTNDEIYNFYNPQVDPREYMNDVLYTEQHIRNNNTLLFSSVEASCSSQQSSDLIPDSCQFQSSEISPQHSQQQFRKPSPCPSCPPLSQTCCSRPQPPLCQQLILNRNINVYLQIEQFTKQKPIVLSRKQYEKVKRTIEGSSSMKNKKMCICKKYSSVSVGKIRRKNGNTSQTYDKAVQVDIKEPKKSKQQIKKENKAKIKSNLPCDACIEPKNIKCKVCGKKLKKDSNDCCDKCYKMVDKFKKMEELLINQQKKTFGCGTFGAGDDDKRCFKCDPKQPSSQMYYATNEDTPNKTIKTVMSPVRQTASSVEIRYTSVAYLKRVTFSSTDVKPLYQQTSNTNELKSKKVDSILTIFKGPRRMPTPNLGTSIYSLDSDYSDSNSPSIVEREPKPRKPFLQRLMSCLVMRSSGLSHVKIGRPIQKLVSDDSTIDSYHISTSLGAIDMSSSIYDTSASFYSNHTILPINNKMKRGFLSSMRGLLANRKS